MNECGDSRPRLSAGRSPARVRDSMAFKVTSLIPMAHAADVQRAVDFYQELGMEVRGSLQNPS